MEKFLDGLGFLLIGLPFAYFCPRRNLNSVGDYSSSSVGVVCRLSCVVCRVSNLKDGIFSKRFELEG